MPEQHWISHLLDISTGSYGNVCMHYTATLLVIALAYLTAEKKGFW